MQAAGRIGRLGQAHVQRILILGLVHSYDQVTSANSACKMIPMLSGQGKFDISAAKI